MTATEKISLVTQNISGGEIYDLAPVTKSINWKTKRAGAPASLELEVITDIPFDYGSVIVYMADDHKLFAGKLFKIKKAKNKQVTYVFYDQLKYLLRNNSYVIKDKTLADVVKMIANDYSLDVGALNAPNIKLPTLLKEDKSAIDIIQECQDQIMINTGRLTVFWDDVGKLRLDIPENLRIRTVLADASIISDFSWEGSIEDSANLVKLVQDNKQAGRRDVYIQYDSNLQKKWGILQFYKKVDEKMNEAQIKQMAEMYLKLKSKPAETVTLSFSVGDYDFRAGRAVYVDVKEINLHGWYLLDEVTHKVDATGHSMECKLFIPREGAS